MRYAAVAAAFDGTLARNGRCDVRSIDALRALAASGRKLLLVTSLELRELFETFPEARMFDYLVAESGAVLHSGATRESAILAPAPPEILLQELRRQRVSPLSVGSGTVRTSRANEPKVTAALDKLRLDLRSVAEGAALIVLPAGVSKASGITAALRELGLSAHNVVAIGDAENDLDLFAIVDHAVAVQDAPAHLKMAADAVTDATNGAGFVELARELLATDLRDAPSRNAIALGARPDGDLLTITPCRESVLLVGPRAGGQDAMCRSLIQQLLAQDYQCCILSDAVAAALPVSSKVSVSGTAQDAPRLADTVRTLDDPTRSVVVSFAAMSEGIVEFVEALLLYLHALHERTGRPHAVVFDGVERLLSHGRSAQLAVNLPDATMVYMTSQPQTLPPEIALGAHVTLHFGQVIGRATDESWNGLPSADPPPGEHITLRPTEALARLRDGSAIVIKLIGLMSDTREPESSNSSAA